MEDLISRQAAIDAWKTDFKEYINMLDLPKDDYKGIMAYIDEVPSAQPDSSFIAWLLDEVWDEEQWELNWQAFPEILCRKLVRMGYVRERDGEYERCDKKTGCN